MYKYSRKKILHRLTENSVGRADLMRKTGKQIVEIPYNDYHFVVLNLLAQKEDRKECHCKFKPNSVIRVDDVKNPVCPYCGEKILPTPSPLEGNKNKTISQGWACPKCGSVYAIWVSECSRCVNSNIKFTVSSSNTYLK